jgi:uncharacterized protein (DUF2062 family)
MNRIKQKTIEFLKKGMKPSPMAAAISSGLILGVFPIYGPISLLALGLAWAFRLNVPLMFAGYYSMAFVKPILILPFIRLGEFIFQAKPMSISLLELAQRFHEHAGDTLREFGWAFVHAMVGWAVVVPLLALILYPITLHCALRWESALQKKVLVPIAVAAICFGLPTSSQAWPFGQANEAPDFPPTVSIRGEDLRLQGVGVLRYKRLISVYDAALYRGDGGAQRLDVLYRVNARAEQFEKAGEDVLVRNYAPGELAPFQDRLRLINTWYPDPKKGDRCTLTFFPGQGTELTFNGTSLGVIPGDDFARLYFSIWLGEDPASVSLRNQLLNGEDD